MKLIVNPHKIEILKEPVNEREIDITKCEFEFADEITNDYVKEAYFTFKGTSYKVIIVNNECQIPSEVLTEKGQVEIGVVAFLVENEEEIKRYNPSPAYFNTWIGSLKDNPENSEPITPSEMEQYEQALQDGLEEVNDKLDEIDQALDDVNTAIEETNNLDLDVSKSGKTATVTLTKKDATTKVVTLSDGTSLMFNWDGTKLGIKTDEDEDYTYVDLQGVQGPIGPKGEAFTIKKTYSSVAEMNADFYNMQLGDYVMIASTVEVEDNAKLYTRGETQWIFISDFSGATGIKGETGATPNIQIGTVTSGTTPSVTRTGTNENPILNFVLEKGEKGDTGNTGPTGPTGNGIASITKTSTSGLVDTYTITYTNGTTTTFQITNGEDGEVTQAQLDETNRAIDYYKSTLNALPKVEGEGTSITLNDTAEAPMPMSLAPSTLEQETTTGKNKLVYENTSITDSGVTITHNRNGSITLNGTSTGNIRYRLFSGSKEMIDTTKQYTLSSQTNMPDRTFIRLQKSDDSSIFVDLSSISSTKNYISFYGSSISSTISCFLYIYSGYTFNNITIYPMLEEGSSMTSFEPYTGGIPAPNPEFPETIHTISGDNEIKVENKNLLDISKIVKGSLNSSGVYSDGGVSSLIINGDVVEITTTSTYRGFVSDYIKVTAGEKYSISYIGLTTGVTYFTLWRWYDENKTYIGSGSGTALTGAKYLRLNIGINEIGTFKMSNVQLEKGTTITPYTLHQEQSLPLNLPVENLVSASSVSGSNLFLNGATAKTDYVFKAGTYTINAISSQNASIYKRSSSTDDTRLGGINELPITFTSNEDFNLWFYRSGITQNEITNIQLEPGTKANSYTPYGTPALEYSKIGDYEDEFIRNSGNNLCNITGLTPSYYASGIPSGSSSQVVVDSFDKNNIIFHSTSANYNIVLSNVIQLKPSTQYTIKFTRTSTATNNQWFIYDYNNGTYSVNYRDNNTNVYEYTFTTNSLGQIALAFGHGNVTGSTTISNIMLNEGSTALPYEPYGTGKWYLKKNALKVILTGSNDEDYGFNTSGSNYYSFVFANYASSINKEVSNRIISNMLIAISSGYEPNTCRIATASGNIVLNFDINFCEANVNSLRSKLAQLYNNGTPLILYIPLSTPEYILLNDTLQSQLTEIYNWVKAYQDQTNISQVNNDLPFVIKASAVRDMSNIFELITGTEL